MLQGFIHPVKMFFKHPKILFYFAKKNREKNSVKLQSARKLLGFSIKQNIRQIERVCKKLANL